MEKRYQVFVSSTFSDLEEERQEIIQALLELKCIPAGMELFPAANEDQWTLIKKVIDDCDYYILVIAGRYGSLGPEGMSYTEMEYRYALEKGIPTIGFIHKNPSAIPQGRSESDPEKQTKLKEFCEFVQKKVCRYWDNPSDLGSKVSRSLINLINDVPAIGWVKGDQISEGDPAEILRLRKRIEELETGIEASRVTAPPGTERLAQGDDFFEITFTASTVKETGQGPFSIPNRETYRETFPATWNEIFSSIAPLMIDEAPENKIKEGLDRFVWAHQYSDFQQMVGVDGEKVQKMEIVSDCFQTIKVQLRAIGLINKSPRVRSVKDTGTYWSLTPYGDALMTRLRAITREEHKES
jgi:Domain of unknown function (DUF4062)